MSLGKLEDPDPSITSKNALNNAVITLLAPVVTVCVPEPAEVVNTALPFIDVLTLNDVDVNPELIT